MAETTVVKTLTMTRVDVRRHLPLLFKSASYQETGDCVESIHGAQILRIKMSELPDLVISRLKLPQIRIEFGFTNYDQVQTQAFFQRFERIYQRGGG